jgi:cytochrome c peroxidase
MRRGRWRLLAALACVLSPGLLLAQGSSSPAQIQQAYEAAAGTPAQAERGRAFFVQRHGGDWSCASCHGSLPTAPGRHAVTGKALEPLAPAFNPKALSDPRRVEKWLRRNCTDVLRRECSPGEKADVLAWLRSLS